jgi:hypothetical protein
MSGYDVIYCPTMEQTLMLCLRVSELKRSYYKHFAGPDQ